MITTYFRSSSLNSLEFCEQSYFLKYVLGIEEKPNKKTEMGTMVHKVMECLTTYKKVMDRGIYPPFSFSDESLGDIYIEAGDTGIVKLTDFDVDQINEYRAKNKEYISKPFITYGHIREDIAVINNLINKSFQYYSAKSSNTFDDKDLEIISDWAWAALDYMDGMFDPRKLNVVETEKHFDLTIEKDWAKYEYDDPHNQGKKIAGNLSIKGTIDLITSPNENIIEIIDYKTGQRKNWNTGEIKTYGKLKEDLQLLLYHYVIRKLYPSYRTVIATIYYIRHGGPISVCFELEDLDKIESQLKETFEYIKNIKEPRLVSNDQSHFKCTRFCHFGKNTYGDTDKLICAHIRDEIKDKGINEVVKLYGKDGAYNTYSSPGE